MQLRHYRSSVYLELKVQVMFPAKVVFKIVSMNSTKQFDLVNSKIDHHITIETLTVDKNLSWTITRLV